MTTWLLGGKNAGYAGAADRLRSLGMDDVRSPLDCYTPDRTDRQAMDAEIAEIKAADLVVLLQGWDQSPDGRVHELLAGQLGIPRVEYLDLVLGLTSD